MLQLDVSLAIFRMEAAIFEKTIHSSATQSYEKNANYLKHTLKFQILIIFV